VTTARYTPGLDLAPDTGGETKAPSVGYTHSLAAWPLSTTGSEGVLHRAPARPEQRAAARATLRLRG